MKNQNKDQVSPVSIRIANTPIDKGRCYVVAEAGSNHNGDLQTAKSLIDAAADAGADAVKFQAFRAATHYSCYTPAFSYLKKQKIEQSTYELIRSLEIDRKWHPALVRHAKRRRITFLSSPCDFAAIDQLAALDMPAFKLASFDLPDLALIRHMAHYRRPLIFSTGMANYSDIDLAISAAREKHNVPVVLLQCTSLYPAPAGFSNLNAMRTMREAFGVPVGYSDHTLGEHICLAAVAIGACLIEKHFTLDRRMSGPDHSFAIEPAELRAMVGHIRDVEAARGDGIKNGPRPEEAEMFEKGRRSLHVRRDVKAGEILTRKDLCVKRPGLGIAPYRMDEVAGMRLCRSIHKDQWLTWGHLKS